MARQAGTMAVPPKAACRLQLQRHQRQGRASCRCLVTRRGAQAAAVASLLCCCSPDSALPPESQSAAGLLAGAAPVHSSSCAAPRQGAMATGTATTVERAHPEHRLTAARCR